MKKSSKKIMNKKKQKSFSFFTRIITLFILAAAIIIGAVFSFGYLDKNSNLSIEFAGGYQAQINYEGVNKDEKHVINLLENRVDPLGTSNINLEKTKGTENNYNLSISNSAGVDLAVFVNNISRRGYLYLIDKKGHDLLANDFDGKKWTKKAQRITINDAFSKIEQGTNFNSGQPEVIFSVKDQNLIKTIQEVMKNSDNDSIYFYSDIGGLLNYIRNSFNGLEELVKIIDQAPTAKKEGLKALLANETIGFEDSTGERMYEAIKAGSKELINLLDQTKNGVYMIKWKYSDTFDNPFPLSVDTNNSDNTFDPENPFDPKENKGSPVNAWLPYIHGLVFLKDISSVLRTPIINYKYAPYYVGSITPTSIRLNKITINDVDTFNKEKVQQIVNILNAGRSKNNFNVLAILNVDPTLGAQSLKFAALGLVVTFLILSIAIILNYRLLGVIVIFVAVLFLTFTLVAFAFLNIFVGPEIGIALLIGFALLLDTIIGLFNAFQKEYQSGKTVFDAFKIANKKSLVSAFDCSTIVLVVSLAIFWFGTRALKGFAIMTSIATFGVIVFGVLFLRFVLYLLLKNNSFEKKPQLLALNLVPTTPIQQKNKLSWAKFLKIFEINPKSKFFHISQWDFWHKASKWIILGFSVILLSSGIVYLTAGSNFGSGFENRIDFIGEIAAKGSTNDSNFNLWEQADKLKEVITKELNDNHQSYQKVYSSLKLDSLDSKKNVIKIIIETNISADKVNDYNRFLNDIKEEKLSWTYVATESLTGNQLFKDMLFVFAISLIVILVYIIIRFQVPFVMPLIIALILVVFVTLALLSLLQITISTMTISVVLALVILALINSVVIFDNIKDIKINHETKNKLTKAEIIAISNQGIKKSLSRTLAVNSIIILSALIVVCFLPNFWAVNLAIIIGTIITFIATHFIGPWLWTFFEKWRIKHYQKRIAKIKKHFVGPDEYIIPGVND